MELSRRGLIGAGLSAAAMPAGPASAQAVGIAPSTEPAVDAAVRAALDAGACPGVRVEVQRRSKPLLSRSYGLANLETGTPVSADSVFRVGSLTKQFTAALIVKLAEQGRLGLEDPASKH